MNNISVVINTRNEAEYLPRLLASVKDFADEIVVIDMRSSDNSPKIAREFGAKVYDHEPLEYVEPARNFGVYKAIGDWILVLDPDEVLQKSLLQKLKEIIRNPKADYYSLPRKNIIFNKWIKHSRWWPDYNIRFFKKGSVSWSEIIHAVPMTKGRGMDLEPLEENAIIHYHYTTVDQYIGRLNRYTTEQAKVLKKEGYEFTWKDIIKRPANEFLSRYFRGEGYKDGIHGLALAGLQATSELVLYLKLWELGKFEERGVSLAKVIHEMKDSEGDLHYWQADVLLKNGGGFKQKIKRKFKLP